jgi:hypothetical protein
MNDPPDSVWTSAGLADAGPEATQPPFSSLTTQATGPVDLTAVVGGSRNEAVPPHCTVASALVARGQVTSLERSGMAFVG